MEDGEENYGGNESFIDSLKLKFSHQFWSILSYIVFFGITSLIFGFFFSTHYVEGLDPDNVRYILSALIQSQAAIVTLTVPISLIAAQFMSSSYSIRIIEIFRDIRKNPDLWIILGLYLSAIIFDIYVLVSFNFTPDYVLDNDNLLYGLSSVECVGLSLFLGIFAILSLIPYIFNTLSILRLNTTIKILGEDIKSLKLDRHKNQSLQIFHDLLISGISKYDVSLIYFVTDELDGVFKRILNLITESEDNEKEKSVKVEQLTRNYQEFINQVQDYAFKNRMESAIFTIIYSIDNIIEKISPLNFVTGSIFFNLIDLMTDCVIKSVNYGFTFILWNYNDSLDQQIKLFQLFQRNESLRDSITASIMVYSEYKPEKEYDIYFEFFLQCFDQLIIKLFEEKNTDLIDHVVSELNKLIRVYIQNGLKNPVERILITNYAIFNKCDDIQYNSIIKKMIASDLWSGFVLNPDPSEIKELFLIHLHVLQKDQPELFDEELIKFKEYLKENKTGILIDVREVFPDE